jgi:hypothetical protein
MLCHKEKNNEGKIDEGLCCFPNHTASVCADKNINYTKDFRLGHEIK